MPAARSRLRFERGRSGTALVECQTQLPLLVQRPLRGPEGQAVVVLLTPAGALFDADVVSLSVTCGEGVDVTLASASATRLNRCDTSGITLRLEVELAAATRFRYLPYELIPFRGARLDQAIAVTLHADAEATLLEIVGPGTTEAPFTYTRLDFETLATVDGVPSMRERLSLTTDARLAQSPHTHYGSLLLIGAGVLADRASRAHELLASFAPGVHGSASTLPSNGIAVKALGSSAQSLRTALLGAVEAPGWLAPLIPP